MNNFTLGKTYITVLTGLHGQASRPVSQQNIHIYII